MASQDQQGGSCPGFCLDPQTFSAPNSVSGMRHSQFSGQNRLIQHGGRLAWCFGSEEKEHFAPEEAGRS